MHQTVTLVGDGIENPGNARAMMDAAGMFGSECRFRYPEGSADTCFAGDITLKDLRDDYDPVMALDNLEKSQSLYGFSLPRGSRPAMVVGNERRGIGRDVKSLATRSVEIPMVSRKLNCLNVAAASAVGLYYLTRGGGGKLRLNADPESRRPGLLLLGPGDHVELGSSIRSAGAFGWKRLWVDDRQGVWFGCERGPRTEGRAASRQARNPIHLVPTTAARHPAAPDVCVVTATRRGIPLHRANLSRGSAQLIIIPDESAVDIEAEPWEHYGHEVRFVHLDLPRADFPYRYRLVTAIALAEIARQVGQRSRASGRTRRQAYDYALHLGDPEEGETVFLEDLDLY